MHIISLTVLLFALWSEISSCFGKLSWGSTKYLIAFGDDFTSDGFNISAGISSPVGRTSSNGMAWPQYLGAVYNVTDTAIINLACAGATMNRTLVAPTVPEASCIIDQVALFQELLAPKPEGAEWNSSNTLFAFLTGINDVRATFTWTNISQSDFHSLLMDQLSAQLEDLYACGARSFLFLTIPPIDRAPLYIQQGPHLTTTLSSQITDYNTQLSSTVALFQTNHPSSQVSLFDTQKLFNGLLDNSNTFGYFNTTGYCGKYVSGTPAMTTQVEPCAPASSYFWLDDVHPTFVTHAFLAHGISTMLST